MGIFWWPLTPDPELGGDRLMATLYPDRGCACHATVHRTRWSTSGPHDAGTQFGSRRELLELPAASGVPMTSRDTYSREGIIKRLWRALVLPGSIAMFDEQIAREAATGAAS